MPEEVLWISFLDPQFTDIYHLRNDERARAETDLLDAAFVAAKTMAQSDVGRHDHLGKGFCQKNTIYGA